MKAHRDGRPSTSAWTCLVSAAKKPWVFARPPLRHSPSAHLVKDRYHLCRVGSVEHAFDAHRIDVGERAFVKQSGFHRAALGQMVHDHVDEFDLIGGEGSAGHERIERPHGGFAVESNKRTNEQTKPPFARRYAPPCRDTARSKVDVTHLLRLIPARLAAENMALCSDGSARTTNWPEN